MSHEFESGLFANGLAAWHGQGFVYPAGKRPMSIEETLRRGGIDWLVVLKSVFLDGGVELKGFKALSRLTDGQVYNVVSDEYVPVQNTDMGDFLDPFLRNGSIEIETAGSLRNGANVWLLGRIVTKSSRIAGAVLGRDPIEQYVLITLDHSGSSAVTIKFTNVRVVCANTLGSALRGGGDVVRIVHNARARERLKSVQSMIDMAGARFKASLDEYEAMAGVEINGEEFKRYVKRVLQPAKAEADEAAKALAAKALEEEGRAVVAGLLADGAARGTEAERVAVVQDLLASAHARETKELQLIELPKNDMPRAWPAIEAAFENSPGHREAGKTAWGAYNAVTYWLDHERGKDREQRLYQTWYGSGADIRERAHEEAIALTK